MLGINEKIKNNMYVYYNEVQLRSDKTIAGRRMISAKTQRRITKISHYGLTLLNSEDTL